MIDVRVFWSDLLLLWVLWFVVGPFASAFLMAFLKGVTKR